MCHSVQFPDRVEHSARMIPLGISHLCSPCMTVDGKTYGSAGRSCVCVQWKRSTPSGVPLWPRLRSWWLLAGTCRVMLWAKLVMGKLLWLLAQREGHTVGVTLTPLLPEQTAAKQWVKKQTKQKEGFMQFGLFYNFAFLQLCFNNWS